MKPYSVTIDLVVEASNPDSAFNKIAELTHSATFLALLGKYDASDPDVLEPLELLNWNGVTKK